MGLTTRDCRNCKYCIPASYGKMFDRCVHRMVTTRNIQYCDIARQNICTDAKFFEIRDYDKST